MSTIYFDADTENIDLDFFPGEDGFEVTLDEDVEAWMTEMLSGPQED